AGLVVAGAPPGSVDTQPSVLNAAGKVAGWGFPMWGEQVLPAGDLDPDQGGGGVAFAFTEVRVGVAMQLGGDVLPVCVRDEPVGEHVSAAPVVDEWALVGGDVEFAGECVDGGEERRAVVGVAAPEGGFAV